MRWAGECQPAFRRREAGIATATGRVAFAGAHEGAQTALARQQFSVR